MFTRKAACLAVVCAVLTAGSAAYGAFTAGLYWGDEAATHVANTLDIPEAQATIELVLWDNQVFGGAGADYIQWVHLNFANTAPASTPSRVGRGIPASWANWPRTPLCAGAIGKSDSDPSVLWRPASPVRLGKVTLNKPAYVDGGFNEYLLSLRGGTAGTDETFLAADFGAVGGGVAAASQGTLGSTDVTMHILPEPATIALLGIGAAMTLIRRRKRA